MKNLNNGTRTDGGNGLKILVGLCILALILIGTAFALNACSEAPTEPVGCGMEQIDHNQNHRPPSEGCDTLGDTVCAE